MSKYVVVNSARMRTSRNRSSPPVPISGHRPSLPPPTALRSCPLPGDPSPPLPPLQQMRERQYCGSYDRCILHVSLMFTVCWFTQTRREQWHSQAQLPSTLRGSGCLKAALLLARPTRASPGACIPSRGVDGMLGGPTNDRRELHVRDLICILTHSWTCAGPHTLSLSWAIPPHLNTYPHGSFITQ